MFGVTFFACFCFLSVSSFLVRFLAVLMIRQKLRSSSILACNALFVPGNHKGYHYFPQTLKIKPKTPWESLSRQPHSETFYPQNALSLFCQNNILPPCVAWVLIPHKILCSGNAKPIFWRAQKRHKNRDSPRHRSRFWDSGDQSLGNRTQSSTAGGLTSTFCFRASTLEHFYSKWPPWSEMHFVVSYSIVVTTHWWEFAPMCKVHNNMKRNKMQFPQNAFGTSVIVPLSWALHTPTFATILPPSAGGSR